MNPSSLRHAAIVVSNIERSLKFYTSYFNFELIQKKTEQGTYISNLVGMDNVVLKWAKLNNSSNTQLELLEYVSPKPTQNTPERIAPNRIGANHIAITVSDCINIVTQLKKDGFHIINQPQLSPDKRVLVCYAYDPDGSIIEIVEDIT